jgi:hypothetical protein
MSNDLVVIVPSRGRPDAAVELAEAFTETGAQCRLVFALDDDDPTHAQYAKALTKYPAAVHIGPAPSTMVHAMNAVANLYRDDAFALGFMGDDHRPRTTGWDRYYLEALRDLGTGIVYGNDLLQGSRIPTQCALTSDIVRALGFMAPPTLTHLFVDNFWRDLAMSAGCLRYLPDVVVEHMHPVAGKAGWDAGHVRVNQPSMYARDQRAYRQYQAEFMEADMATVSALRGAA